MESISRPPTRILASPSSGQFPSPCAPVSCLSRALVSASFIALEAQVPNQLATRCTVARNLLTDPLGEKVNAALPCPVPARDFAPVSTQQRPILTHLLNGGHITPLPGRRDATLVRACVHEIGGVNATLSPVVIQLLLGRRRNLSQVLDNLPMGILLLQKSVYLVAFARIQVSQVIGPLGRG